jgi:hypothetical protein
MWYLLPIKECTFRDEPTFKLFAKSDHKSFTISIYKNTSYKGKEMDILYKALCFDTQKKLSRIFYIQKVNRHLKNQILANFAFVEPTVKGENLVYPFGWDTEKIEVKDINENCISIIERKIKPL